MSNKTCNYCKNFNMFTTFCSVKNLPSDPNNTCNSFVGVSTEKCSSKKSDCTSSCDSEVSSCNKWSDDSLDKMIKNLIEEIFDDD